MVISWTGRLEVGADRPKPLMLLLGPKGIYDIRSLGAYPALTRMLTVSTTMLHPSP